MAHQSRRHVWAFRRAAFSVTENWFFSLTTCSSSRRPSAPPSFISRSGVLELLSGECRGACRVTSEQGALLEGIGQLEEVCFAEGPAEKLHADRNTDGSAVGGGREPAWHRDGGQSSARRHKAIAFQLL